MKTRDINGDPIRSSNGEQLEADYLIPVPHVQRGIYIRGRGPFEEFKVLMLRASKNEWAELPLPADAPVDVVVE